MRHAAQLAVRQMNSRGGITGRPIELSPKMTSKPDSAVVVATGLEEAGVAAVVGHVYSGTTLAAAPAYNGARRPVVQISPSSSAPAVTAAGAYTFRTCPSDLQQGAALARFAAERLSFTRGTILYLNDEYGRGIRATFASEFARQGGMLDDIDPYLGPMPAVEPFIERLARRRTSQFIFLGGNRRRSRRGPSIRAGPRSYGADARRGALEGLEGIGGLRRGLVYLECLSPQLRDPQEPGVRSGGRACVPRLIAPQSARGGNLRHRVSPATSSPG